MFLYASFTGLDKKRKQGIYSGDEYIRLTFYPVSEVHYITGLKPKSKEEAREMAINILTSDRETVANGGECMSYGEWAIIGDALERAARRFGLVREFRSEGII